MSSIYTNDDIDEEYIGSPFEDLEAIEPGAEDSMLYNNKNSNLMNGGHIVIPSRSHTLISDNIYDNNIEEEEADDDEDVSLMDDEQKGNENTEDDDEEAISTDSEEIQNLKKLFITFCFQYCQSQNYNLLGHEAYETCKRELLNHFMYNGILSEKWRRYALGTDQRDIFHYSSIDHKYSQEDMDILKGDKANLFLWLQSYDLDKSIKSFKRLIPLEDFFDALCFLQDSDEGPFTETKLYLIAKSIFYGISQDLVKKFFFLMGGIKKWPVDNIQYVANSSCEVSNEVRLKNETTLTQVSLSTFPKSSMQITGNLTKIEPKPFENKIEGVIQQSYGIKRPLSNEQSLSIHTTEQITQAKDLMNKIVATCTDDISAEYDTTDQLSAHNLFIRRIVDICLDRTVSLSQQPGDVINILESICRQCFSQLDPQRHRTKIGNYLKSCRKSRQKYSGKVFVRETPSHTYTRRALNLMEAAFQRFNCVLEALQCEDNEESPIVAYAVSNCTTVKPGMSSSFNSSASMSGKVSIQPRPSTIGMSSGHNNDSFLRPTNPPLHSNSHNNSNYCNGSSDKNSALVDRFMYLLNKMEAGHINKSEPLHYQAETNIQVPKLIQNDIHDTINARENVKKDLETIQSAIDILKNYEFSLAQAIASEPDSGRVHTNVTNLNNNNGQFVNRISCNANLPFNSAPTTPNITLLPLQTSSQASMSYQRPVVTPALINHGVQQQQCKDLPLPSITPKENIVSINVDNSSTEQSSSNMTNKFLESMSLLLQHFSKNNATAAD